jgi:predicted nucleic acid-binding protein
MIVSDSTALIVLFDLNRIELLENLFEIVYITPNILDEISVKYPVVLPSFIKVEKPQSSEPFGTLKRLLDLGESEAIALAKEKNLSIIIDEKKGRKIAKEMGLRVIGLLGIVYLNAKKGFLTKSEANIFMENAIEDGYRISKRMVNDILETL